MPADVEEGQSAAVAEFDTDGKGWSSMNVEGSGIRKRTVRVMPLLALVVAITTVLAFISVAVWAIAVVPTLPAFKHTKTRSPANLEHAAEAMIAQLNNEIDADETMLEKIDDTEDKLDTAADSGSVSEEQEEKIATIEDKLDGDSNELFGAEETAMEDKDTILTEEEKLKEEVKEGADVAATEKELQDAIDKAKDDAATEEGAP